jgi:hypothetical protein
MTINEQFFNISLPKWPQMLVRGKAVTIEQAKEIILCTDSDLTSVYNWSYNSSVFFTRYRSLAGTDTELPYECEEYIRERLGCVETAYVESNFANSSFIYGAHGWCHPNGSIKYTDNVGKWPSVAEIYHDWVAIAKRFPFLHLDATLYSGESCEDDKHPIVTISVRNEVVTVGKPIIHIDEELYALSDIKLEAVGGGMGADLGLPAEWYYEYAAKIAPIVAEFKASSVD